MRWLLVMMIASFIGHGTGAADATPAGDSQRSAVLVTGASAGIGRKVTERLAAEGYYVFAGARKEQDLKALDAMPNVRGVRLDVTSPADVAAAVELVRGSGRPLHGIVNISSISAFLSDSGTSAYTMSKAGIAPR